MRSESEVNRAIDMYSDTVKRICMVHLKNYADTEDIFQNVFLKYVLASDAFENAEHEKAWIIKVTVNACKDLLKSFFRARTISIQEFMELPEKINDEHKEVLEAVLSLPEKYKDVIYLHYYEGYSAVDISKILGKNVNTIYTLMARARKMLYIELGGSEDD